LSVIKNGINPILNQYDYPELSLKIGTDEGENVVVLYGQEFIRRYPWILYKHNL